jgi:pSer/pThr/pTyr-binding forkhead associated (FHA) protein
VFVDGGVEVEDMNSACGTFVDGARVRRAVLREGSGIAFGNVVVQVTTG